MVSITMYRILEVSHGWAARNYEAILGNGNIDREDRKRYLELKNKHSTLSRLAAFRAVWREQMGLR